MMLFFETGFLNIVSNGSVPKDALEDSIEAILRIHFYYNVNATEVVIESDIVSAGCTFQVKKLTKAVGL